MFACFVLPNRVPLVMLSLPNHNRALAMAHLRRRQREHEEDGEEEEVEARVTGSDQQQQQQHLRDRRRSLRRQSIQSLGRRCSAASSHNPGSDGEAGEASPEYSLVVSLLSFTTFDFL